MAYLLDHDRAPQHPDAIARAILQYLDDGSLAARHGAAGRMRVLGRFSLKAMVSAYARVYESLVSTP
jgi:glycosyltransferase involved in cell wall biosynthesis